MRGFYERNTFGEERTDCTRAHKSRLLLKYLFDNDYKIKCKVRWIVCGYSQIKGIDYFDTYSPTPTNAVVFLLMHLIAKYNLVMTMFDVSAAFLEGR